MKGAVHLGNIPAVSDRPTDWIEMLGGIPPTVSGDEEGSAYLFGEIYDDNGPKADPTLGLLAAYRREGDEFLGRLNGQFALMFLENRPRRFSLICDRTASTPIFYANPAGRLLFASTLRELIDLIGSPRKISLPALASFLACGFFCNGLTLIEGARLLAPGQMLVAEGSKIQVHTYWEYGFGAERDVRSERLLQEELYELLLQAIARRTKENDRFGIMLSGGYDSRALLACVRRLRPAADLHTVTWGEAEGRPHSDAEIARTIALKAGAAHSFFKLSASALPDHFRDYVRLSEGRTDAVGNYPEGLTILERCRDSSSLAYLLRGDECFGDDPVANEAEALHGLSLHRLDDLSCCFDYVKIPILRALREVSAEQIRQILQSCPPGELYDRRDYLGYRQYLFGYLNPLNQLKQRAIAVRNPHLDNDIVNFINRLPSSLRLGKAFFRQTVERMMPEVCRIEFARRSSMINWNARLQTDSRLQAYVRRVLLTDRHAFDDLIDHRLLGEFLQGAFSPSSWNRSWLHRTRKRWERMKGQFALDPASQVFRLMILKIWTDEFMSGHFELAN